MKNLILLSPPRFNPLNKNWEVFWRYENGKKQIKFFKLEEKAEAETFVINKLKESESIYEQDIDKPTIPSPS